MAGQNLFKACKWEWLLPSLAFALNSLFLAYDLPEVIHPDEPATVRRAIAMGTGDFNPHFFVLPTLWIYLVFLGQSVGVAVALMTGFFKGMDDVTTSVFTNPTFFFSIARLMSAAFGAGAVWLTWCLGSRISRLCGWVAALSLSMFAPFVWQAHYATGDSPLMFFILLCLIACLRGLAVPATKWESLWWPAISAGLATSVKYNGVAVFGAVAVMLFLRLRKEDGTWGTCHVSWRSYGYRLLTTGAIAAIAGLLTSPYILLDFSTFCQDMRRLIDNAVIVSGHEPDPFAYARIVVTNQGVLFLLAAVTGWGLLFATAWGRRYRSIGWVLGGFFLPYLALIQWADAKTPRYYLPLAPLVALGSGIAVGRLYEVMQTWRFHAVLRRSLIFAIICVLLAPSFRETMAVERGFSKEIASGMASTWFRKHVEPSSTVFIDAQAGVNLPPDRETVEQRMQLWQVDGSGQARQLLRAYTYYLSTDVAARGYRLIPTGKYLLNTFHAGYDLDRDYDVRRLDGVRYVVAPEGLLRASGDTSRDVFYRYVRTLYCILRTFTDWRGTKIIILERNESFPGGAAEAECRQR